MNAQPQVTASCVIRTSHRPFVERLTDPETKRKFDRANCKDCRRWLGDTLVA